MVGQDENFLDLKKQKGEVLKVEHGFLVVKRGFFADRMDLEQLPQRVYEELRSTGAVATGVTETSGNGEEREEHKMNPTTDLF